MGILGSGTLLLDPRVSRGLYASRFKRYNVYVDGELIRFKGMTSANMTRRFAEESVAEASHLYLQRILTRVHAHLNAKPQLTIVYMDGERVRNKMDRKHRIDYDVALVRASFVRLCRVTGYAVCELDNGESELQMYLRRDRQCDLNVFVTNDSDMLSICYGHRAIGERLDDLEPRRADETGVVTDVSDRNWVYRDENVRDSCLWIKCASGEIRALGMDALDARLDMSPRAFRVFACACGTDFTVSLLTNTMISAIMNISKEDRDQLRRHDDDALDVLVALIYVAVKNGGTLKRRRVDAFEYRYDADDVRAVMSTYASYVTTGDMRRESMPRLDGSSLVLEIVYAMTERQGDFTKKYLQNWATRTTMEQAVRNFRRHVGSYAAYVGLARVSSSSLSTIDEDDALLRHECLVPPRTPRLPLVECARKAIATKERQDRSCKRISNPTTTTSDFSFSSDDDDSPIKRPRNSFDDRATGVGVGADVEVDDTI